MEQKSKYSKMTRRTFLRKTGVAAAGITILPNYVVGGLGHTPPSDKLNIAGIGVGGRGGGVLKGLANENIVALCDVEQPNQLTQKEKQEGWMLLFNGKNFEG